MVSLGVLCWLCLYVAVRQPGVAHPVTLLKALFAIGAWFPFMVWWVGETAAHPKATWSHIFRGYGWVIFACVLTAISCSDLLIPSTSTPQAKETGIGMQIYAGLALAGWLVLLVRWVRRIPEFSGIRRIELQVIAIGGALAGLAATLLTVSRSVLGLEAGPRLAPFAILLFYAVTAWAITTRRVFGAKELYVTVLLRFLGAVVGATLFSVWLKYTEHLIPQFLAVSIGMAVGSTVALFWSRFEEPVLALVEPRRAQLDRITSDLLNLGRGVDDPEKVVAQSRTIISDWARADVVISYIADSDGLRSVFGEHAAFVQRLLAKERGFTTDGLRRRAYTQEAIGLADELERRGVSAIAFAGAYDATPNLCLFLGPRQSDEPYRWNEVCAAVHWAESLELLVSRALLVRTALEREKIVAAGMLGASIAHEIRNPLVAIKTGAQLLPEWNSDATFVQEFSETLQRELGRIEELSEQLLNLSSPKKPVLEHAAVNDIVAHCVRLLEPRFRKSGVDLSFAASPAPLTANVDKAGMTQVLLNLLVNAQQAVTAHRKSGGWVRVETAAVGRECRVDVVDNGPGIPAERRKFLFQPFHTTKAGGVGLGLVISAGIVSSSGGRLTALDVAEGARFRIVLPLA